MNDDQIRWIRERFAFDKCLQLPVFGSQRNFFRLSGKGGTRIVIHDTNLQQLQEAVKKAVLFRDLEVRVPDIYDYSRDLGLILEEDLGDVSLEKLVNSSPDKFKYYQEIIDILVHWQKKYDIGAVQDADLNLPVYDAPFARRESRMFVERYLQRYSGLNEADCRSLNDEFDALAQQAAGIRRTLMHRDFQARNIMWHGNKPCFVDYQAAMQGPYTYDLAALVYDNHVTLEDDMKDALINYFYAGYPDAERDDFYTAAVQRTLQAISAYAFFVVEQGKGQYEQYIKPGLKNLAELSERFPWLERLCV